MIPFKTKIVATLGPSSSNEQVIKMLMLEGARIFRLNFSHGQQHDHLANIEIIRRVSQSIGFESTIVADLCGPKIRVGSFVDGKIQIKKGDIVTLDTNPCLGSANLIHSQYPQLAQEVSHGTRILLDDGLLEFKVLDKTETQVKAEVIRGGILKNNKGMNLPGLALSVPALTEKDKKDVDFIVNHHVDYIALSFVRSASDVKTLQDYVQSKNAIIPVIAKIEKPQAVTNIDEILSQADGIMVARGDLGVEMDPEKVPIIQKDLIRKARAVFKPVIVATQMLESMTSNQRPTRAEVSDVSNAVFEGTDALMLSGETAAGLYPVESVQMMRKVSKEVESWQLQNYQSATNSFNSSFISYDPLRQSVAKAIANITRDIEVCAVVVRSRGGKSASVVSSTRLAPPILALSTEPNVVRKMNLLWGVSPVLVNADEFEEPKICARKIVSNMNLAKQGKFILLLSGFGKSEPAITVLPA
ncbi:MAG: pyruvate kinase [Planctomycetes bacterium]|nr:pyruvate kinase [Planctomycetota bacterium]NBY02725.1 pyruvate kinase [Planctomycetota bacterium]